MIQIIAKNYYIQQEQNDKFSINWLINIVTLKFFVTILMNQYFIVLQMK